MFLFLLNRSNKLLLKLLKKYERRRLVLFLSVLGPDLLAPLLICLLMIFDPLLGVLGGIVISEIK